MSDKVEFYEEKSLIPFLTVDSAFQPSDGDLINIRSVTYKVLGTSFTVDYADKIRERYIRCNVICEKVKP